MKGDAVSNVVGVVVLIAVAVLAMGIIIAVLLSTSLPTQVPAFSGIIWNTSKTVYITHEGGDPLTVGQFKILVNGNDVTGNFTRSLSSSVFSLGMIMNATFTYMPQRVVVVHNTSWGGGSVLASADLYPLNPFGWYSSDWKYRKKITISHTMVASSDQTNFPVLVSIAEPDINDPDYVRLDGYDMFFTASDGTSPLPYEIEYFERNNGKLVAWVKVPTLSSSVDTVLYLYFGNPNAPNQQNPAGVFSNGYAGVWHLGEAGTGAAGEYKDSSGNGNNGQGGDGDSRYVPGQVSGKIGYGQDFTNLTGGKWDFIDVGSNPVLDISGNQITLEAWARHNVAYNDRPSGILTHKGWENGYALWLESKQWQCPYTSPTPNCVQLNLPEKYNASWSTTLLSANTWYHVVATYNGSWMAIYINGQGEPNPVAKTDAVTQTTEKDVWIGHGDLATDVAWSAEWSGQLDEVRISNVGRSDSWIRTEYNNQNSPGAYLSVTARQTAETMS